MGIVGGEVGALSPVCLQPLAPIFIYSFVLGVRK